MQPVQASQGSSSPVLPPTQESEKKRKHDELLSSETSHELNPTAAQDTQKMFASMATSGGVARVPVIPVPVQTTTLSPEKREEIMQIVQAEVKAILTNPKIEAAVERGQQDPKSLEAVKANIAFTESYYTPEEKAVCAYLTKMGLEAIKPILQLCTNPHIAKASDEVIEVAIKYGLQFRTSAAELDSVQKACVKLKACYGLSVEELVRILQMRPTQTAEKAPSIEKAIVNHEMTVVKATIHDPMLLLSLIQAKLQPQALVSMQAEIGQFEAQATPAERAFFAYLATATCAEYKPLLAMLASQNPMLQGCADEAILTAIKKALYPKVKEATAKLEAISPEHVAKMVKVSQYQPYILQLGMLQKKLEALPTDVRDQVKEAASASDKEVLHTFLLANSARSLLKELDDFLLSVPEAIYGSIVKGLFD